VTVVLIFNVLLALLCLYVVWQVCRLRAALTNIADTLIVAEHITHQVLHNAPQCIATRQIGAYQLRQDYRLLTLQMQKVQQVLTLLGLGQLVLRRYQQNLGIQRSPSGISNASETAFPLGRQRPRKRRTSVTKPSREPRS
jgi:hypothetical protein